MAVNTLAIKPIVRVMAKPLIGPVPNMNRKKAETTVVTCVSIMVRNALSKPASTAEAGRLSVAQFFADALEHQNVGVDAHADGQNHAGDAGQRQHRAKHGQRGQQDDQVE